MRMHTLVGMAAVRCPARIAYVCADQDAGEAVCDSECVCVRGLRRWGARLRLGLRTHALDGTLGREGEEISLGRQRPCVYPSVYLNVGFRSALRSADTGTTRIVDGCGADGNRNGIEHLVIAHADADGRREGVGMGRTVLMALSGLPIQDGRVILRSPV